MQTIIGGTGEFTFDRDRWVVVDGVSDEVEVLISADIEYYTTHSTDLLRNVPIATRFDYGEGRGLYTAFHNEGEATTHNMTDILEEIILSL